MISSNESGLKDGPAANVRCQIAGLMLRNRSVAIPRSLNTVGLPHLRLTVKLAPTDGLSTCNYRRKAGVRNALCNVVLLTCQGGQVVGLLRGSTHDSCSVRALHGFFQRCSGSGRCNRQNGRRCGQFRCFVFVIKLIDHRQNDGICRQFCSCEPRLNTNRCFR